MNLSAHFTVEECRCKHCGKCEVTPELLRLAESVRHYLGDRPMITKRHSVYRCKEHNATIKGASPHSQHVLGRAMDFHIDGLTPWTIYVRLREGSKRGQLPLLHGLGVYDWGVHIDCRDKPGLTTWDYRTRKD